MTLEEQFSAMGIEKKALPRAQAHETLNAALEGDWEQQKKTYPGPRLSQRALSNPAWYSAEALDKVLRLTYEREEMPDGLINLGIAENTLQSKEYIEYYGSVFKNALRPYDLQYGNQASGSRRLHKAIASLWNDNFAPLKPVLPDDIICGPGLSSVLDQLAEVILDEGQGVMIATPHYNGFYVNMVARSRATIIDVMVPDSIAGMEEAGVEMAAFEKAYEESVAKGITPRAVLLCNPQNPWGRTYSKQVMLEYALFCEKYDLHLISDEIYALSVFDNPNLPNAAPFISFAALDVGKETGKPFDMSRVHIVYSFSKDFGVNGFRLAFVFSQYNRMVIRALTHTCFLMSIAAPVDALISTFLNDKPTFNKFMDRNRALLAENAAFVRDWFEKRGMRPIQSNAGHFMMIDARERLALKSFEEEHEFGRKCVEHCVGVGIGDAYHCPEPGYIRVTFTFEREILELALSRLEAAIKELGK